MGNAWSQPHGLWRNIIAPELPVGIGWGLSCNCIHGQCLPNVFCLNFLQAHLLCPSLANYLHESLHLSLFPGKLIKQTKYPRQCSPDPIFSSSWEDKREACESSKHIYKQHVNMFQNLGPKIISFQSESVYLFISLFVISMSILYFFLPSVLYSFFLFLFPFFIPSHLFSLPSFILSCLLFFLPFVKQIFIEYVTFYVEERAVIQRKKKKEKEKNPALHELIFCHREIVIKQRKWHI